MESINSNSNTSRNRETENLLPSNDFFHMSYCRRLLAGSGHILNDITGCLWFTYILLYMQKISGFSGSYAAGLMFLGQIVDGVATPLIGYVADKLGDNFYIGRKKYGRCKSWHLIGAIMVATTCPFVFSPCVLLNCDNKLGSEKNEIWPAVYYGFFITIFQIGWAANQIAHLALIPKLHPDKLIRTEILAIRYGFTVASNLLVFTLTSLALGFGKCTIDSSDASPFRLVVLISVGIGVIFTILFHIFVHEQSDADVRKRSQPSSASGSNSGSIPISRWLTDPRFYILTLMYMGARHSIDIVQAYVPLYVQEVLALPCGSVAYIPLTMFSAGFVVSTQIKWVNKYFGRNLAYAMGSGLCLIGAAGVLFLPWSPGSWLNSRGIYPVAAFIGGGSSAILVTSLAIAADMIGNDVGSGAFVYGAMSFADKLSGGSLVLGINKLKSLFPDHFFYQRVVGYTTGVCAFVGVLAAGLLSFANYLKKRKAIAIQNQRGGYEEIIED